MERIANLIEAVLMMRALAQDGQFARAAHQSEVVDDMRDALRADGLPAVVVAAVVAKPAAAYIAAMGDAAGLVAWAQEVAS